MTSLEKSKKNKGINLEADLLLSKKDFAAMRKKPFEKEQNLEDYFDFLFILIFGVLS